jgi:hypothetical protein
MVYELQESTWGVPCARTMPGKLKAIGTYSLILFYNKRMHA